MSLECQLPRKLKGGLLGQHIEIQSFRRKIGREGGRKKEKGVLGFLLLLLFWLIVLSQFLDVESSITSWYIRWLGYDFKTNYIHFKAYTSSDTQILLQWRVLECLPNRCNALALIPRTTTTTTKNKQSNEGRDVVQWGQCLLGTHKAIGWISVQTTQAY